MNEAIHLIGEGGAVFEMTLPLHRSIAKRYEAGDLQRVNADGSPYEEPQPRKRRAASKDEAPEDPVGD